jgi:tape measure domain-containing protein
MAGENVQEVLVIAKLAGTNAFLRDNEKLVGANMQLAASTREAGLAMEETGKRGLIMTQMMYTLRRGVYFGTLALVGFGVEALKMGYNFDTAMQTATVALRPFFNSTQALNRSLNQLWTIAKYSPFQIKDMTLAFRAMYPAFRQLGISADDTVGTIKALVDALAVSGKTTPASLNRVSVALQHMAFLGHVTGQTVNQLARDGIPIFNILTKELGLTGDQIHRIGTLGIPSMVLLKAFRQYIETTPGYMNAAYRQSTQTLHGLFTTFKDNISRLFGALEMGGFGSVQQAFKRLDDFFNGFFAKFPGRSVTIHQFVQYAFGSSAATLVDHFVESLKLLVSILENLAKQIIHNKLLWGTFYLLLALLVPLLKLVNWFVKDFGFLLYILIPLLIAWKIQQMYVNLMIQRAIFYEAAQKIATKELTIWQVLLNKELFTYKIVMWAVTGAQKAYNAALIFYTAISTGVARNANGTFRAFTLLETITLKLKYAFLALMRGEFVLFWGELTTAIGLARKALVDLATTLWERVVPAEVAAWIAGLGPIAWIIAAVVALIAVLVVLYFKWKAFHDLVNATVKFLWDHPILLVLVPIVGWIVFIIRMLWYFKAQWKEVWDFIADQAEKVWHKITQQWTSLKHDFNDLVQFIKDVWGSLEPALIWPFKEMWRRISPIINWIVSKLSWVGHHLGWLGHIPGEHFVGKYLLGLADGGTMRQPGMALVGERGPELLLLPGGATVLPLPANTVNANLGGGHATADPLKRDFRAGYFAAQDVAPDRPLVIQLMLDKKVLEEVTVTSLNKRVARR